MERGLHAQLGSNEFTTLHRIQGDGPELLDLRPSDVRQHMTLELVEYDGKELVVTALGVRRLERGL